MNPDTWAATGWGEGLATSVFQNCAWWLFPPPGGELVLPCRLCRLPHVLLRIRMDCWAREHTDSDQAGARLAGCRGGVPLSSDKVCPRQHQTPQVKGWVPLPTHARCRGQS